jgi:hypothetical protein
MVKSSKRKRRRKQNGGAVQEKGPDPEEKRDQRDEAKEAERGAGDKPATKGADVKAQEAEFKKKESIVDDDSMGPLGSPKTNAAAKPEAKYTQAQPKGPNNKLPHFPVLPPTDPHKIRMDKAEKHTKLLSMYSVQGGGGRSTRKRINQRGGQSKTEPQQWTGSNYGKPGIGSESSICGPYQTPDELRYTPDKYIVVPQPAGGVDGALSANDTTINLAKTFTQAKANSEGDYSTINTKFRDDKQTIGNLKLTSGGYKKRKRKSRRRKRRKSRKSRKSRKRRGGRRTKRRKKNSRKSRRRNRTRRRN